MPRHYHYRPERSFSERHHRFEVAITAAVLIAVIATILIFVVVFHDFPLRATGQ
jgi:hypothetical protein